LSEFREEVDALAKAWLDRYVRDGKPWPSLEPHGRWDHRPRASRPWRPHSSRHYGACRCGLQVKPARFVEEVRRYSRLWRWSEPRLGMAVTVHRFPGRTHERDCSSTRISESAANARKSVRSMTPARLSVEDTLLERLAQDLEDLAAELGEFIQEEHAMVCQRDLAWQRHVAPADQPDVGNGMMGRATRARRDPRRAVAGAAGDAIDARGLQGLGQRSSPAGWWGAAGPAWMCPPRQGR
jgi:hypothetical protein